MATENELCHEVVTWLTNWPNKLAVEANSTGKSGSVYGQRPHVTSHTRGSCYISSLDVALQRTRGYRDGRKGLRAQNGRW